MATRILSSARCIAKLAIRQQNVPAFNCPLKLFVNDPILVRWYAKKGIKESIGWRLTKSDTQPEADSQDVKKICRPCIGGRRAKVDLPKEVDPDCPFPCEERKKKKRSVLHWLKLKFVEGGTNFGTPFRRLECKPREEEEQPTEKMVESEPEPIALPPPDKPLPELPKPRDGVNVTILGADSPVGHYVALLLKQCPCVKRIRLYESKERNENQDRDICNVVQDLKHIDTNCTVQAYGGSPDELSMSLQNSHIVLMLESEPPCLELPLETRFCCQAPKVRKYVDAISQECPGAFIIMCIAPIDCMVPLATEVLNENGFYDPRKLMGSMSVAEMRASTLAARALGLEPSYTRVPCIGGTEGETLVPVFSRACELFEFARHNAELMTETVRFTPKAVAYSKSADLSEAHAHANLVKAVAHGLLCQNIQRVSGFVESDSTHVISPARFMAVDVLLSKQGICKKFDIPSHLNDFELDELDLAFISLQKRVSLALEWYHTEGTMDRTPAIAKTNFHIPRHYDRLEDCQIHLV